MIAATHLADKKKPSMAIDIGTNTEIALAHDGRVTVTSCASGPAFEGYQIDMNGNKCLSCHARARIAESLAPMISITHFMDRDGQFLATVSPRRFFCTECHVPQHTTTPPVTNDFVDIDSMLNKATPGGRR